MPNYDWVIPQLTVLNKPQIKRIYEFALKILSTTGVRIDLPTVI